MRLPVLAHLLLFFLQQLLMPLLEQAFPELGVAAADFTPGHAVLAQVQLTTLNVIKRILIISCGLPKHTMTPTIK